MTTPHQRAETQQSSRMDRRQWLVRSGALAVAGAVPLGFAWNALAGRRQPDALWFEADDGYFYQHSCAVDGDGLWIDEHDGFMYLYGQYELTDGGIWLTLDDGQSLYFECLTNQQAEQQLTDV